MTTDDDRPDYSDEPLDEPTLVMDRKVLLIALGGLAGLAVVLAVLRARLSKPVGRSLSEIPYDGDWRSSVEHLAAAFDLRLQGIDARLEALSGERVVAMAAYSAPPVNLDQANGSVDRVPPAVDIVGAEEPPPPGPAAVSMPPAAS